MYDTSEKYSSYKNRFFNKYLEKARQFRNAVNQTSLKEADKTRLKKQIAKILNGDKKPT